jgi:3-hydroxyisobutyrate dehydrogenase-like beta-hydroxyacid dehydrogenase
MIAQPSQHPAAALPAVSLLGLGPMGEPMARNLLRTYGPITVWNRTGQKALDLKPLGASAALSPREAAAAVTLTVLPDLIHVQDLLHGEGGLIAGWADKNIAQPILVIHGTVSPVAVATFAHNLWEQNGVRVIDAPLSGGTVGATEATLSIMIGGNAATAEKLQPIFAHLGTTIRYLGESGAGATAKACNQVVVAGVIVALSEAFLLAKTAGLDLVVLRELLQGGLAHTTVLKQKGDNWVSGQFLAGGSAINQVKDLHFITEAAEKYQLKLPVTAEVSRLFTQMVADGNGQLDHTGVYLTVERMAGNA